MFNGASSYRRFLNGDDNGLVEIVEEYKDGLILFLNRYVSDVYVAEDLAEDTFFKLVISKPRYVGDSSFKAWLYTIARNLALNYLKKNSRMISKDVCDMENIPAEKNELEDAYFCEERKKYVSSVMKKLNLDYSTVLFLIYFEDFSIEQAAHIMKKSKRQIENLLYRAKQSLKRELLKEGMTVEKWL